MSKNFGLTIFALFVVFVGLNQSTIASGANDTDSTDLTLSKLENRFFEHQYGNDTDTDRLNRLDQFVFGCNQTGPTANRLSHLMATIPDDTTDKISGAINQVADEDTADSVANNQTSNNIDTSTSDNANQTLSQNDTQSKNDAPSGRAFAYSSYPSVTSLEQELLGHAYANDALSVRLTRLEIKAFGAANTSNDLSKRVDLLEDYAQRHDIYNNRNVATAANNAFAFAPIRSRSGTTPNNTQTQTKSEFEAIDQANPFKPREKEYISKTGSFVGSIEERVAMMEAQEFGHTYPDRSLDKRLNKLESKVLPNQNNAQLGIFQRAGKLWIALHPADKVKVDNLLASNEIVDNRIVSKASVSSSSAPDTDTIVNRPNNTHPNTNTAGSVDTKLPKQHSWLSKLGNAVGTPSPYGNTSTNTNQSFAYPYPGTYTYNGGSAPSGYAMRSYGASFGPGAGPAGLPIGFW